MSQTQPDRKRSRLDDMENREAWRRADEYALDKLAELLVDAPLTPATLETMRGIVRQTGRKIRRDTHWPLRTQADLIAEG